MRQDVTYKDKYGATITIRWSALDSVPQAEIERRRAAFQKLAQELRIKYARQAAAKA